MDGAWVLAVVGVVSSVFVALNTTLEHIPALAQRIVNAMAAMREVKAAFKARDRE